MAWSRCRRQPRSERLAELIIILHLFCINSQKPAYAAIMLHKIPLALDKVSNHRMSLRTKLQANVHVFALGLCPTRKAGSCCSSTAAAIHRMVIASESTQVYFARVAATLVAQALGDAD